MVGVRFSHPLLLKSLGNGVKSLISRAFVFIKIQKVIKRAFGMIIRFISDWSEESEIMMIGIIEDDRLLNQALNKMLTDKGYDTTCAHSCEEALGLSADCIDLYLIDIGLPDGDGLKLYRDLRAEKDVPAIFLTARDEEQDMLAAFDTGADDYVVKPFSMKVLLKRIEVVLKRNKEGDVLTCGDITLYPEKKQVFSDDEEISLTAKEYQLLKLFMANQNQVLTKENILDRIWGIDGEFVEENTLSVTISRLKKKLGREQSHIRNVFGLGYRMGE